jgi:lysophospholipase L1-like esterase
MSISQQDDIIWIGDSLTTGFGAGTAALQLALAQNMTRKYAAPNVPTCSAPFVSSPRHKWPDIVENAVSGRKTVDIGATMASFLATNWVNKPTAAIIQLGIPDVVAIAAVTETLGQMHTATFQIVDALFSTYAIPYAKMIWLGPWQNNGASQSTLDSVRAQLLADMTTRGCQFIDLYGSGIPFSGGNSTDGVHATPAGAALLATYATNLITFTN